MNKQRTYIVALALLLFVASTAFAHHILGIPHYAYDERYPQTPIIEYRVNAGSHEVKMTGYPGKPRAGEQCSLHVYIRRLDNGEPFADGVTLTVMRDALIGEDPVIYGPVDAELDEAMYKFYPIFKDEANHLVRIAFYADDEPWTIDLEMVVGEPGSPWTVVGLCVAGVVFFLVVIRAIRIKMLRRERGIAACDEEAL